MSVHYHVHSSKCVSNIQQQLSVTHKKPIKNRVEDNE